MHDGNHLLILAGAGSGKTRVITFKIAYRIELLGEDAHSILALTFTKKAAQEMRERAIALCPQSFKATLSTFHSFGARFLRQYVSGRMISSPIASSASFLSHNFTVYDDADSIQLLSKIFKDHTDLIPDSTDERSIKRVARHYSNLISLAKDKAIPPDGDLSQITSVNDLSQAERLYAIYSKYEEVLHKTGNVDFGDLILLPTKILNEDTEACDYIQSRYQSVMVDEYQDVNMAQVNFIKAICSPKTYLCVVGDDDQSIYKFRGSEARVILDFPNIFPKTDIIKLTINYRSTQPILDMANAVIKNNIDRMDKVLVCANKDATSKRPELHILRNDDEEVNFVVSHIEAAAQEGASYSDFAIVYRINALSLGFEKAFTSKRIPYKVVGGLRFFDREEVKTCLAYLKYLSNNQDFVSLARIINVPPRHIGAKSADKILNSLADNTPFPKLTKTALDEYTCFCNKLASTKKKLEDGWRGSAVKNQDVKLSAALHEFFIDTGLIDYYKTIDDAENTSRVANIIQLVNIAYLYPCDMTGLSDYLDSVTLDTTDRSDDSGDFVTLITAHNTKGLEFRNVIIVGCEEGLFPFVKNGECDTEEERRLFYVSVTRAQKELYLTQCRSRLVYGRTNYCTPSVFLSEARGLFSTIKPTRQESPFSNAPSWAQKFGSTLTRTNGNTTQDGDSLYRVGTKVHHLDYGDGIVTRVEKKGSGDNAMEVITVQFGDVLMRFIPKYQGGALRIIE